jgi:hypothetical protein
MRGQTSLECDIGYREGDIVESLQTDLASSASVARGLQRSRIVGRLPAFTVSLMSDRIASRVIRVSDIWTAGRDLREQPLRARRDQMEAVLAGQDVLLPARRLADDGLKAWAQMVE